MKLIIICLLASLSASAQKDSLYITKENGIGRFIISGQPSLTIAQRTPPSKPLTVFDETGNRVVCIVDSTYTLHVYDSLQTIKIMIKYILQGHPLKTE